MSVHPDGTGTGWTNVETVDVDQPHGKDYLYGQHIAKGVRKRINKEHKAFGDTTAGGEHLPGGCRVLGITDATADLTAGAGDKTGIDITDGLFQGRGLVYDQTTNALWCYTGDGTISDDPYELMWGARCICKSDDFTWLGQHQFGSAGLCIATNNIYVDQSVDCSDLGVKGDVSIAGKLLVVGDITIEGSMKITTDLTLTGNMSVDGQAELNGNVVLDGTVTIASGAVFNFLGDYSSRSVDTTYTSATDGIVFAYAAKANTQMLMYAQCPAGTSLLKARTNNNATSNYTSVTFVVKKGYTWAAVCDPTSHTDSGCFWLPFGDNT